MNFGNLHLGAMMKYPDNTIQSYENEWWIEDNRKVIQPGRLVRVVLPHIHLVPWTLIPEDRGKDPTDHKKVRYSMKELKLTNRRELASLPPAAFPLNNDEHILAYRGKKRYALVIYSGEDNLPVPIKEITVKWQKSPMVFVVPYYGAEKTVKRVGFPKEFIERVKMAEFPNFYWDLLPFSGSDPGGSICKLDHIYPLGKHHDSIECLPYKLSPNAFGYILEWLRWLIEDVMDPDGFLRTIREELIAIEKI